ncbi:MAG: gliding motility lipoprotein GldD [Bacteroidota bacterium]
MKKIICRYHHLMLLLFFLGLFACKESFTPKPLGYHRVEFPEKSYQAYEGDCPFRFQYPDYAELRPDKGKKAEPCWMNMEFPGYQGTVHISYKKINNNLDEYIEDSRNFAYKHSVKADAINEKRIYKPGDDVYGLVYNIEGDAASSLQFFLTDSSRHFIRGALYFRTEPNKDSLRPVIQFFSKDIHYMIETFSWK